MFIVSTYMHNIYIHVFAHVHIYIYTHIVYRRSTWIFARLGGGFLSRKRVQALGGSNCLGGGN